MRGTDEFFKYVRSCALEYKTTFRFWCFGITHIQAIRAREAEILMSSSKHAMKSEIYKFLHRFLGQGLLNSNGEKWRQRRKILTPTFHFNILQNFLVTFNEECLKTVDMVRADIERGHTVIDCCALSCRYTLHTICETAMGVKIDTMAEVRRIVT